MVLTNEGQETSYRKMYHEVETVSRITQEQSHKIKNNAGRQSIEGNNNSTRTGFKQKVPDSLAGICNIISQRMRVEINEQVEMGIEPGVEANLEADQLYFGQILIYQIICLTGVTRTEIRHLGSL